MLPVGLKLGSVSILFGQIPSESTPSWLLKPRKGYAERLLFAACVAFRLAGLERYRPLYGCTERDQFWCRNRRVPAAATASAAAAAEQEKRHNLLTHQEQDEGAEEDQKADGTRLVTKTKTQQH